MSLRVKLATAISMFILILTMLVVGVLSLSPANIPMGGSVNFAATDVYVKITGEVEGAENSSAYVDLPVLNYSGTTKPSEPDLQKWQELDVDFNSSATPIKVKITIENLSTERWLLVNVIEGGNNGSVSDNLIREVQKENGAYTLGENHTLNPSTGEGTSKVEFTINLTVDDPNYSVNTVYNYIINLNNSNEAPAEPAKELDFTFDGNKVTGYTGSETNIIIPSSYSIQEVNITEFIFTEEDYNSLGTNYEASNKMGMLYALKNYTIYPNGQTKGILCENGFSDFMEYMTTEYFPIKVELPEDLTFEFSEGEFEAENPDQYTTFKKAALEQQFLQSYYVKFSNSSEILCESYQELLDLYSQKKQEEGSSFSVRINNTVNKYFEGDDYEVNTISQFSLSPTTTESVVITIPSSITNIEPFAFSNIKNSFSIVLEEGINIISDYAFSNCLLTSITFPATLTKIGAGAFAETPLTSLNITSNIKRIGEYAFYGCSNLESVSFEEGLEEIGAYAFSRFRHDNNLITQILIPSTVKKIGEEAFSYCANLENVSLSEGLEIIEKEAFLDCSKLKNINIPDSIEFVGDNVFGGCSITSYFEDGSGNKYLGNDINNYVLFYQANNRLGSISVDNNCKIIYYNSFLGCSNLQNVTLNEGILQIGSFTFNGCYSLKNISIPSSIEIVGNDIFGYEILNQINCNEDEDGNFYLGNANNKFVILVGVKDKTLATYEINENCKIIYQAFLDCTNLTNINIPLSVVTIGDSSFSGCSSLNSINITEGILFIGNRAFEGCNNLENLVIPKSVIEIGDYALGGDNISSLTIEGNILYWGKRCLPDNLKTLVFGENVNMFAGFHPAEFDAGRISLETIIVNGEGLNGVYLGRLYPSGNWTKDGVQIQNIIGPGTYTNIA